MMIKQELAKDPTLAEEDWSRFLPKFKKKNTSKRKKPLKVREKKQYTPFPPAPMPSKIDLQLDSGEYFLNEQQREMKKKTEKKAAAKEKSLERRAAREEAFVPSGEEGYDAMGRMIRGVKKARKEEEEGGGGGGEGDGDGETGKKKKRKSENDEDVVVSNTKKKKRKTES